MTASPDRRSRSGPTGPAGRRERATGDADEGRPVPREAPAPVPGAPAPSPPPSSGGSGRRWVVQWALLGVTIGGLLAGAAAIAAGATAVAHGCWAATTAAGILPAAWWVLAALRRRRLGADVVALLALVGTLVVGEYLAGAVIAVMLASGRALEAWAAGRARHELTALAARAPTVAHALQDGTVVDLPVDRVAVGSLLVVKPGDVVPIDGRVESGQAVLDEAALTGEAQPVERAAGEAVRSGVVNAGGAFPLRTTTTAAESTYAGIVRLVAGAQASAAPSVRLADRYAGLFLALSLAVAGGVWLATADLTRAVAVLVVATPCPLILAVPVALVAGLSRSARCGVVVKGGDVLERLAGIDVLLVDKTGTLTVGRPAVADVVPHGGLDGATVLALAASLDQVSPHVLAAALVRRAHDLGLPVVPPVEVDEVAGQGILGRVGDHTVAVGKAVWACPGVDAAWVRPLRRRADRDGMLTLFVGVDGRPAGVVLLDDPIRPDAARTVRRLRTHGIRRVVMVTGDRLEPAEAIGAMIGVDEVLAERSPAEKVEAVRAERSRGRVAMVGDGINDAPALALADVGVAMGARGATASSEAADVVLTVDRLDRLGEAAAIARRARRIAGQSAAAGIGLSLVAMGVAAAGYLPAVWGAVAQEAIDVLVILNALRALHTPESRALLDSAGLELARRFRAEHAELRPLLEEVRAAADAVSAESTAEALGAARRVHALLSERVVPHELAEDAMLYPALARALGGVDPTGTMSRAHLEIAHQTRRLGRLLDQLGEGAADAEDLADLRQLLYGLHAILELHFAQEDESYLSLADVADTDADVDADV